MTTLARTPKRLQQRHHRSHQSAQPGKDPKAAPVPIRKYRHRGWIGTKCVHVCVYMRMKSSSILRTACPAGCGREGCVSLACFGLCFGGLFGGLFRQSQTSQPCLKLTRSKKTNKQTHTLCNRYINTFLLVETVCKIGCVVKPFRTSSMPWKCTALVTLVKQMASCEILELKRCSCGCLKPVR